jgi:hypothetical protein
VEADKRGGARDSGDGAICLLTLIPASLWFVLIMLRWLGIADRFSMLRWSLEETGTGFGRGFFLLVLLPAAAAVYALILSRTWARPSAAVRIGVVGLLLAIANLLTWRI